VDDRRGAGGYSCVCGSGIRVFSSDIRVFGSEIERGGDRVYKAVLRMMMVIMFIYINYNERMPQKSKLYTLPNRPAKKA
jgi:hypothetical protein